MRLQLPWPAVRPEAVGIVWKQVSHKQLSSEPHLHQRWHQIHCPCLCLLEELLPHSLSSWICWLPEPHAPHLVAAELMAAHVIPLHVHLHPFCQACVTAHRLPACLVCSQHSMRVRMVYCVFQVAIMMSGWVGCWRLTQAWLCQPWHFVHTAVTRISGEVCHAPS